MKSIHCGTDNINLNFCKTNNDKLTSANTDINFFSTGFSLNKSKQSKNLIKDTHIQDYDMVQNNHNVRCSTGTAPRVKTDIQFGSLIMF